MASSILNSRSNPPSDALLDESALSSNDEGGAINAVAPRPVAREPLALAKPSAESHWRKRTFVGMAALLLLVGGIVAAVATSSRGQQANNLDASRRYGSVSLPLSDAIPLAIGEVDNLTINGGLSVNGALMLTPQSPPAAGQSGQIYYDKVSNQIAYYNGLKYVDLLAEGDIAAGNGLNQVGNRLENVGVLSLQGKTGQVALVAGDGIAIDGTTVRNTGVTSFGGASGGVSVGRGLVLAGTTLQSSGVLSVAAGTPNLVIANDGNGNLTISSVGGGTGSVTSSGGTAGRIAKFTGVQNIEDSLLSESGSVVTIGGDVAVTGVVSLSTALAVTNGGTGAGSLTANGVIIGQGSGALTAVTAGGSGLCLISTGGAPSFQACPGGSGVATLNGLTGGLSIANATGGGSTITIDNATTAAKGIASFNSGNFSVLSGAVNTIQDIGTGAAPTFASINTNAVTPSGALVVGATGQNLTLQGNGNTKLTATSGGFTNALQFATPASSNKTITLPNASGTVAVSASGLIALDASGNITCPTCGVSGSGVVSLNGLTGALSIANASGSGATVTINDASNAAKGIASFNVTNFTVSSGAVNTVQNINTLASPTFAAVNTNSISPTSSLTVGDTGQAFTLQGTSTSTITATGGGFTTTVGFSGTPTGAVTYRFDRSATPNTYTICTTAGNCAGVGGGVTTSGGTTGKLAKFSSAQGITDSLVSESGSVVTVAGVLAVNTLTPTGALVVGDTAQSVTIQGNGTTKLTATVSGITNSLQFAAPAGSNKTVTIPNASGTVAVSAGGALNLDAAGNLTCPTCLTTSGGVGNAGVNTLDTMTGDVTIQGTANQITVSDNTGTKQITLSLPQNIQTTSSPTFNGLSLTSLGVTGAASAGSLSVTGAATAATVNDLTLTANATGFSVAGGTASRTLTVTANATVDQNIATSASPTFASLTLTTALTVANGGTGATSASGARTNLGAAASGANGDITSLTGLTTALTVAQGGTGATNLTQNGVLVGNGTGAVTSVVAGGAGNCLISTAGAPSWTTCPGSGGVTSINSLVGALTLGGASAGSVTSGAGTITLNDASSSIKGLASFNNTNLTVSSGAVNTVQNIGTGAAPTFNGLTLTTALTVANGGTGATSASGARTNLGAAASGANGDITSLTAITGITSNGNLTIKPSADTSATFVIQNASSVSLLTADASNGRIYIGVPAGSVTATLLVLSNQSAAADPSGVEGGMYYNAVIKQFRCYRDAAWETCGLNPIDRGYTFQDEFLGGSTTCGNAGTIGALGWACNSIGAGTTTLAYNSTLTPTADRPGILKMTPSANAASGATLLMSQTSGGSMVLSPNDVIKTSVAIASVASGTTTMRVGISTETGATTRPTNSGLWWEADPTNSANWNYCYSTGSAAVCAASGTALTANTFVRLEIRLTATGAGTSAATFIINGTASTVSGVTINSSNVLSPNIVCFAQDATQQPCYVDYYQLSGIATSAR